MWYQILSKFKENYYLKGNVGMALLVGLIILVLALYVLKDIKKKKLPPGPIGLPIFGYYFFLGKKPEKTLHELVKKYGNVMGLYLGPQYIVFLNDWDAMKEAYCQNAINDRPPIFDDVPFHFGFAGINGEEWVQARRLASKAMKDIGLQNTIWEQLIQEEVADLVEQIIQHGDRPIELRSSFRYSFANNIITLVLGKRLHTGHSYTKTVTDAVDLILENTPTLGMSNFSPTLSRVLEKLGLQKECSISQKIGEFGKFISNTVDNVTQSPDSEKEDSFITRFHNEVENHKKTKEKTLITDSAFKGTVLVLLAGGSETSRCTIIWLLMAMAENQDKQRKVHEELDRVLGKEGFLHWPERFNISYTFATILESMRWATVLPFSTMRVASEDIQVQGYHIPKGTFVTANTYSLHNDTRYWKEPGRFLPERFLLEDGKKVNTAPESYNPFSYGKRICPGKLMAMMEILQYFCILMQNFKVIPKEGDTVKHDSVLGLTYQAINAELRFIPRK